MDNKLLLLLAVGMILLALLIVLRWKPSFPITFPPVPSPHKM